MATRLPSPSKALNLRLESLRAEFLEHLEEIRESISQLEWQIEALADRLDGIEPIDDTFAGGDDEILQKLP